MRRALPTFLSLAVAAFVPACSSPTTSTELSVDTTASPDPATASESHGVTYQVTNADSTYSTYEYAYRVSFTVTIQETGGQPWTSPLSTSRCSRPRAGS